MYEILDFKTKKEKCTNEINNIKLEIEKEKVLLRVLKDEKTRLYSGHMQVVNTDVQIHKNNNKRKKKIKNEFHKCQAEIEKQNQSRTFHPKYRAGRHQRFPKGYYHKPYMHWSRKIL